ncbi:MAG TPA: TonB-dependent receptor [bacterium]|nr:TonB-dependent receptor [bacterium]
MLNKLIKLSLALILIISGLTAQIYSTYQSDTIVVTGTRIPTTLTEISRNVKVINSTQIEQSGATSIDELLAKSVTGDFQARGMDGVQTDLHLRGSSFNQVLILIDGMKVNDPQTGHHNLNLPLTINDIKKVEVLKGAGSRLYGPNAMGGIINIITRQSEKQSTSIKLSRGQNKYFNRTISMVLPLGNTVNRVSYALRSSDGYRYNTDYDISTFFYRSSLNSKWGNFSLTSGVTDKDFGANQFYTPGSYPDQREKTEVAFVGLQHYLKPEWGRIRSRLSWRQHGDTFVLDHTLNTDDPGFYQNDHTTELYTAEVQATLDSKIITPHFGLEVGREEIASTSLGNHFRNRIGLYIEGQSTIGKFSITPGLSVFYYSDWTMYGFPGLDISYELSDNLNWIASIEKSFSPPTYTNLYYNSPVNQGNSELKPEEAWSLETGWRYENQNIKSSLNLFLRDNKNMIDYAWNSLDSVYIARNVNDFQIYGSELSLELDKNFLANIPYLNMLKLEYTKMSGSRQADYKSKYVFNYLQDQAVLTAGHSLVWGLKSIWNVNYQNRINYNDYWLIGCNLYFNYRNFRINLTVDNILDTEYYAFGYLPMPGRWIKAGITLQF